MHKVPEIIRFHRTDAKPPKPRKNPFRDVASMAGPHKEPTQEQMGMAKDELRDKLTRRARKLASEKKGHYTTYADDLRAAYGSPVKRMFPKGI